MSLNWPLTGFNVGCYDGSVYMLDSSTNSRETDGGRGTDTTGRHRRRPRGPRHRPGRHGRVVSTRRTYLKDAEFQFL